MELEIGKEKRFWQDVQLVASAAELGQRDSRTYGRLVYYAETRTGIPLFTTEHVSQATEPVLVCPSCSCSAYRTAHEHEGGDIIVVN